MTFRIAGARRYAVPLVMALGIAGCEKKHADLPPPVRPVLSLIVAPTTLENDRIFTGTVQPRYQAQLGFQAAGRVVSRAVNVGDRVTKREVLATLDPTVPRLALASAQADLANAQATLVNAKATNDRQQELIRTGSVSQSQVDAAVAGLQTATAKVNQAQASLVKAQEQLGYTSLESDYDGVVAAWDAEVGQIVSANQVVVTVARPDIRDAVFDVPDDLIDRFPPGASFSVFLLADDSVTVIGDVREIAPQSDAATRTRRIRLTLDGPSDAFRLGTTARITLTEKRAPRIEVPQSAILAQDQKTSVWLVGADGKVAVRPVVLGGRHDTLVTVTSGLSPGDRVVTAGVHSLSDGQSVKIAER